MKNLLVQPATNMKSAMETLNKTAEKVLLIIDHEQKLLGTLTDGDIRRHILKTQDLSATVENIYNKNPIFVFKNSMDLDIVKKIFIESKITLIPIINQDRQVVDYITWDKAFGNSKKKVFSKLRAPVVIMAGGKGTRLDPFTRILPKPLIPIGDKPIIELIMDKFHEHGTKEFYVTLNHKSKMIKAYFEEFKKQYNVKYIDEDIPLGTAGGLKYLPENIAGPIFVSNSDVLIQEDYGKILKYHKKSKSNITIVASVKNYDIPYGICEIESGGLLKLIKEKPCVSFLVNTGMYVIDSVVLSIIPEGQSYHMTQLINDIKGGNGRVTVYPISENAWMDVGEWEKYGEAIKRLQK